MVATGKIQLAPDSKMSFVSYPPSPTSFRAAKKGSLYIEFDIDSSYLRQGGREDWFHVAGPGSYWDIRDQKLNRGSITGIPDVTNIERIDIKQDVSK